MPDESTARGGSRKDGPILGPDEQTATRVGDLLVDEDTGEILDWPASWSGDRTSALIENYEFARQQEARWTQAKRLYALALGKLIEEVGTKTISGDAGKATAVASGVTRSVPAANVKRAVDLEFLTDDQAAELMLEAANDLDAKIVEQVIEEMAGGMTGSLLSEGFDAESVEASVDRWREHALKVLIEERPRAGYVRVTAAARPAPTIEQEVVEPFDA